MTSPDTNGCTPRQVFHYTDLEALRGIVGSSHLWATRATQLNDPSEISYGLGLVSDLLKDHKDTPAVRSLREMAQEPIKLDRLYVLSASTLSDDVSQWQRYGAGGSGLVIGLDTNESLTIVGAHKPGHRVSRFGHRVSDGAEIRPWAPVLYGPDDSTAALNELVGWADQRVSELESLVPADAPADTTAVDPWVDLRDEIAIELDRLTIRIKHRGYSSEAEVRLVTSLTVERPEDVGTNDKATTPKNHLKLASDPSGMSSQVLRPEPAEGNLLPLPISSVGIGPCVNDSGSTRQIVGDLLDESGYGDVVIWPSDCPVRCPMGR